MKMRYIEDVKDKKHEGKEFWILGCGPSLDDFPDDFFDDKISIGLNASFVAFPNLTYFCTGHGAILQLMVQMNPELLKRTIWILSWRKDEFRNHPRIIAPTSFPFKYKENLICTTKRLETRRNIEVFKKALKPTIEDILQKKKICHVISARTIAHFAIQCAAILGAKKITLVGCDGRTIKHSWHAQNRGMHAAYSKIHRRFKRDGTARVTYSSKQQAGETDPFYKNQMGIKLLAEAFAPFGIEVRRYFYGKDYKKIK